MTRTDAKAGGKRVDAPGSSAGWSVWREDDHGGRFEIRRGMRLEDAEQLVRDFESRGHKQSYWREPTREPR